MGIDVTMDMTTGRLRYNDCAKLRAEVERLTRDLALEREQSARLREVIERLKIERMNWEVL
jgi:hypothetical protein